MSMNEDMLTTIPDVKNLTYEQMNIIAKFQRLWIQVALWMRTFFKSTLEDSKDLPAVTARLFEIPADSYNAVRPYFSEEVSQQFYNIIYGLINTNYELVNAYKNNDTAAIDASTVKWYQGASEFAAFLASVNKFWDEALWNSLLFKYGQLKIQEIIAYYTGNYENEIKIYDSLEDTAALIANYMARGIIAMNEASQRTHYSRKESFK
ncbi:MAG TPA: hypothetical protein VM577_14415 [Anaerovoracaceae bacterium]|nr:hypothetical protein [Anaerovoracaceae bacterium]